MSQSIDNSSSTEFKVLILGDAGVGKTSFISRHTTGEFKALSAELSKLSFYTNKGKYNLDIWDLEEKKIKEENYSSINACILMFDLTEISTYNNIIQQYHNMRKVCGDIPIVMCGNKVDCIGRKVKHEDIFTLHKKFELQYYDISAKSTYNFEKPFLYLLRKLTKNDDLSFDN